MNRSSQQGRKLIVIIFGVAIVLLLSIGVFMWANSGSQNGPMKTVTLPNGKVAVYPDNEANQKIGFKDAGAKDSVLITYSGMTTFLSSVSPAVLDELCGPATKPIASRSDTVGTLNTDKKEFNQPKERPCMSVLDSSNNSDAILMERARTADNDMSNDITAFLDALIIR